jgi:hypothetical protein
VCASGFECPLGSTSADAGVCPAGYFCEGGPRQPCPAGRYSNRTGTVSGAACVACPAGTYSAAVAASSGESCVACAPLDGSSAGAAACWPGVVSVTAFNPVPVTPGFSVGDVVVVNFSSPTNASAVVVFTPSIGATSSSWRAGNRELWLTVVSAAGVDAAAVDVATGALSVSVSGVFSSRGASPGSEAVSRVVGGTWGLRTPPVILDVSVVDTGRNVGPGTNDTLTIVFDQAVRQVGVGTPGQLAAVLTFQPAFPAAVTMSGTWATPASLVVTLTVADGELPDWTQWNPGTLTVAVRAAANLTSANGESGASNSSATVGGGSWGDAPSVAVSPRNATAVVLTLNRPASTVGYSASTFVVQWATAASFLGSPPLPETVAGVEAWLAPAAPLLPALDTDNRVVASVALVPSGGPGSAVDAAVVRLTVAPTALVSPLRFDVPRLTTSTTYHFRGACNGPAGVLGPVVASDPAAATPQPPRVVLVVGPLGGLPTPGGVVLEAVGEQLGALGSSPTLVLSSSRWGEFRTPPCAVVAPGSRVRCTSPAGVGTDLAVVAVVDGVASPPYANGTLSYSPPAITGLRVVSGGGAGAGVPTSGGGVVVVEGVNFGPAALGGVSLGAVSYSPLALSVLLGAPVSFPALDCAITRDHSEVTCSMGPGVGGGLQWSITVAGQTATTATTTYRPPIITSLGVASPSGGAVSWDPAALGALATSGGQRLVRALRLKAPHSGPSHSAAAARALPPPTRGRAASRPPTLSVRCVTRAGVCWGLLRARQPVAAHCGHRATDGRGRRRRGAHQRVLRGGCWAHHRALR